MSAPRNRSYLGLLCLSMISAVALTSCGPGGVEAAAALGKVLGSDVDHGTPITIPAETPAPTTTAQNSTPTTEPTPAPTATPTPTPTPAATSAGDSCHSSDSNKVCLSLKYLVYKDPSTGAPVVTKDQAIANLKGINSIWSQCNLAFQIDEFAEVNPEDKGLTFKTADYDELETVRKTYEENNTLLVVTTGTWNRSGSLGDTGANAWTNLPGEGHYGVVLEKPVGTFAPIIAHELGHYLNLQHVSDSSDVMNAIIYDGSTKLTSSQCSAARSAAINYWTAMLR